MMHKCEHGKTIVKFCMFEHCQSKQTGGCQDCIKKYHNHIGQFSFLNQDDIKNVVKKFQIEANYRPKSRSLQQCIFNFFTHVKTNLSLNLDMICKNLINEIGYPYLQKNGTLNCYKRLKNKQYKKVSQKQLKELWEIFKVVDYNEIVKQEKIIYNQAILNMEETLQKLQKNVKDIFENLISMTSLSKLNAALYDRSFYTKINDIFKDIKKYPDIAFSKLQSRQSKLQLKQNKLESKQSKKQTLKQLQSPTLKKKLTRDTRDVSLDKHVKIQNKLKTQPQPKIQDTLTTNISNKQKDKQRDKQANNEVQKDKIGRKVSKYSFEMRPQQLIVKPQPSKLQQSNLNYSEKQQEINQRKKKLMDLMNSKSIRRQDINEVKQTALTPMRYKTKLNRIQIEDYLKQQLSPDRLLLAKQFSTPSNLAKYSKEQFYVDTSRRSNKNSITSKRAKTAYQQEEEQPSQSKKQTRNQTQMSSQTQTESLFNAKIHIPIQDMKPDQEFQINQESVQKCIFVPQIDNIARGIIDMVNQCQSPLLMKKKQIQNFSKFMKLAQSKIIEQKNQEQILTLPIVPKQQQKSFVKINKILEDSDAKTAHEGKNQVKQQTQIDQQISAQLKSSKKQDDSVQINENEQMSLAMLLKSLKLSGAQAIPYLQKAIQYSTSNLSAAQYLSYLYLQTQRPQDCLKLCNDILKIISSSQSNDLALRLNINKSAALNYLGRYSECITFLQRCLRYRHNDILYKNLADAYYSIGILEKAIYNYEHAIIQNSSNTEAHYNLAVCHYQQQNYHNASIYIEKALKHQPGNQVYKQIKKYNDQKILSNQC